MLERLLNALVDCGRAIPPALAWRLGAGLGALVGTLPIRDVRRCREHLAIAYPERDAAWVARTARATFRHFGGMALWTLATLRRDPRALRRGVMVEGVEHLHALRRACRAGEGTVIFTGHVGNWELMSRLGAATVPLAVVGRRLRSALADRLVQGARTAGGAQLVYQDADLREFTRVLRGGRVLATLTDQDIPRLAGVFVPWYGRLAWTPSGPAAMAQLTRSGVQSAFLYRRAGRWVLHFGPRRRFARSGDHDADVQAITAWATAYQESIVRRVPEQWAWWHKRWRTRPEDRPPTADGGR